MRRSSRRWTIVGMVTAVVVMVPASMVWACVALISLINTGSQTVQPGGSVTLTGREFAQGAPVDIHLDSPTGPVLATAPPPDTTMTSSFTVNVPIPADVKPGPHVLVATQNYHNMNGGSTARSIIYVGTSAPVIGQAPAARPTKVLVESGPSVTSLILIGLGAAAAGLFLAALWYVIASRQPPQPRAEAVSAP
jgi:hypothetical protein